MKEQEKHWVVMDEILSYYLEELRSRMINSTTEELELELESLVRKVKDNISITI